jgi:hypothetical protein
LEIVYSGLRFLENSRASDSSIQWAVFEQAETGIYIFTGSPLVQHSTFRSCSQGIWIETKDATQETIKPNIDNCAFRNHSNYAVYVKQADAFISGCRFENNGTWRDWDGRWVPENGGAVGVENSDPTFKDNTAPAHDIPSGINQFVAVLSNFDRSAAWEIPGYLDNGDVFPYFVKGTFNFRNSRLPITLTIPAGVTVIFNDLRGVSHNRIDFSENAAIVVQGTETQPVLFTSLEPDKTQQGVWNGIRLLESSRASESSIHHAVFEQTAKAVEIWEGKPSIQNSVFRYGNEAIWVETSDNSLYLLNPRISDCTFTHQSRYGVFVKDATAQITSCRFENNGTWRNWNGRWVPEDGGAVGVDNADPVFSGNTAPAYNAVNGINQFVRLSSNFDIDLDWEIPGTLDNGNVFPYFVPGTFWVQDDGNQIRLTVQKGVKVIFQDFRGVSHCRINIGKNAALRVQGSESEPVIFTGVEPDKTQTGVWTGIEFHSNSLSSDSLISQAVFEQADQAVKVNGGTLDITNTRFHYCNHGIYIQEKGNLQISGCSFLNSRFTGVYAADPGTEVKISGCIIKGSGEHGVRNDTQVCVDARNNYWGHSTGPLDSSDSLDCVYLQGYVYYRPSAQGDKVTDHVIYDPWNRSQSPCICPDEDKDGVPDAWDDCLDTPQGSVVNSLGCPVPSDLPGAIKILQDISGFSAGK